MANPYIELVERRDEQEEIHVLFVGAALAAAGKVFKRDNDPVKCQHEPSIANAVARIIEKAKERPFDCIMIDMRHDNDGSPLNVITIAALENVPVVAVMANPDKVDDFKRIPGVQTVLPAPVDPKSIIKTIVESPDVAKEAAEKAAAKAVEEAVSEQESEAKHTVTSGFEDTLSIAAKADRQIWMHFVPLANFIYKKTAIIVLSALFLAFLTYGAMIVFFMASSSWSMPFELSTGHSLVEKAQRDLSTMRLRSNQIGQDLARATMDLENARREQRDGKLSLALTQRTIEEELRAQSLHGIEIERHIKRLQLVISDFNRLNSRGGFAKNLKSAYEQRLITRKAMNSGTLAVLETMHRMATVESELAVKQLESEKINRRREFLKSLLAEMHQPEIRVLTSAGADLAHLAQDVIETKNKIASANKIVSASEQRIARITNSRDVVSQDIRSLENTPVARAIKSPVTVLFVPYTNSDNLKPGTPLYGCWFSIVVCSKVGAVGAPVEGETTSVHPLFGKPMRGTFVEANFSNPDYITEELIHAGRPPLLF